MSGKGTDGKTGCWFVYCRKGITSFFYFDSLSVKEDLELYARYQALKPMKKLFFALIRAT